jgi:hypothetical protein
MAANKDWLPKSRTGQLAMTRDWQSVAGTKTAAWGIPVAVLTELGALITAANTALTTAQNETTRTPVATAQCKTTFDALIAKMRDMKKHILRRRWRYQKNVSVGYGDKQSSVFKITELRAQKLMCQWFINRVLCETKA